MKMNYKITSLLVWTGIMALCLTIGALPARVSAERSPQLVSVSLELKTGGLDRPTSVTHAGDGSGRLFITEQAGTIRIYSSGSLGGTFLDISARVSSPPGGGNEEGLLSMAFPPSYGTQNPHFYVYYTNTNGDNQVSRFSTSGNPNQADPASEVLVLALPHPTQSNHNGGQIAFGPDGYLYIGTGDGGGSNDPYQNAQDPDSLLGKILRIDVEMQPVNIGPDVTNVFLPIMIQGTTGRPPQNYRIPPDNPFVSTLGYRGEIWATGLRNPWRFSFDRAAGDIYIGDVGQGQWEEIDYQPAASAGGENYGWPLMEGKQCHLDPTCNPADFVTPIHDYQHLNGNCSVTGGYVYRGAAYPVLQGIYVYADYCSAAIWGLQKPGGIWQNQALGQGTARITSFGEDENGELYLLYRANSQGDPDSGSLMLVTASGN
jgi:glucose/arabinose dehydrogenase